MTPICLAFNESLFNNLFTFSKTTSINLLSLRAFSYLNNSPLSDKSIYLSLSVIVSLYFAIHDALLSLTILPHLWPLGGRGSFPLLTFIVTSSGFTKPFILPLLVSIFPCPI